MVSLSSLGQSGRIVIIRMAGFLRLIRTRLTGWCQQARFPTWPPVATHFCAFLAGVLVVAHQRPGLAAWVTQAWHFRLMVPVTLSGKQLSPVVDRGMVHLVRLSEQRAFCRAWQEPAEWYTGERKGQAVVVFRQWPEPWGSLPAYFGKGRAGTWEWRPAAMVERLPLCREVERVSYGYGKD